MSKYCVDTTDACSTLQWYHGETEMGDKAHNWTLRTVFKAKVIMNLGNIEERLFNLEPNYTESIDELLMRVVLPLEELNEDARPECHSRGNRVNTPWKEHCSRIMRTLVHSMVMLSRWGVGNASIMASLTGPPPSFDLVMQQYRLIISHVGNHRAALRAFLQTPTYLQSKGMPVYLLMTQTKRCIISNTFHHLPAPPGSSWYAQCVPAWDRLRSTYNDDVESPTDITTTVQHLQSGVGETPRQFIYEVDETLWTGDGHRGDQIVSAVHDLKCLPQHERNKLLSPGARFLQARQVKLENRLLEEPVTQQHEWYHVCTLYGIWAINSHHNVSRPLDWNVNYDAPPVPSHEHSIIDNASWVIMNLPVGCNTLRDALLRVETMASGEDSAQDVMRKVRQHMATLARKDHPAPSAEWEVYTTKIENLVHDAQISSNFEVSLQNLELLRPWSHYHFTPSASHGGPPDVDGREMTEEERVLGVGLTLFRVSEEHATQPLEQPEAPYTAFVWTRHATTSSITSGYEDSEINPDAGGCTRTSLANRHPDPERTWRPTPRGGHTPWDGKLGRPRKARCIETTSDSNNEAPALTRATQPKSPLTPLPPPSYPPPPIASIRASGPGSRNATDPWASNPNNSDAAQQNGGSPGLDAQLQSVSVAAMDSDSRNDGREHRHDIGSSSRQKRERSSERSIPPAQRNKQSVSPARRNSSPTSSDEALRGHSTGESRVCKFCHKRMPWSSETRWCHHFPFCAARGPRSRAFKTRASKRQRKRRREKNHAENFATMPGPPENMQPASPRATQHSADPHATINAAPRGFSSDDNAGVHDALQDASTQFFVPHNELTEKWCPRCLSTVAWHANKSWDDHRTVCNDKRQRSGPANHRRPSTCGSTT